MTIANKSTTKGIVKKLTAEVTKKSKLTTAQLQGVDSTWDWYISQPASYQRLFDAVNLLDTLVNDSSDAFNESLLSAYYRDNPRHALVDELRRIAKITKSTIFNEIADQVGSL